MGKHLNGQWSVCAPIRNNPSRKIRSSEKVHTYTIARYLDSAVHLSYVLLRMLERWGKQSGQMYIRRASRKKKRNTQNNIPEEEGIPDDDSDDEQVEKMQEMLQEMTLEKFESVSCVR